MLLVGESARIIHLGCRTGYPDLQIYEQSDGADMVGMTGMPEASLAREIGLEYAAIAVVANYAAGRGDSERAVPLDKIQAVLDEALGRVRRIIAKFCEQHR